MPATNPQEVDITSYAGNAPQFATGDALDSTKEQVVSVGLQTGGQSSNLWRDNGGVGDGVAGGLGAIAPYLSRGGNSWDRQRTPTTFKTALATALGDTAVWTPAAGKKFRLMAFFIEVTENATTAGGVVEEIVLRDATTPIGVGFSDFVPAAAVSGNAPATTGWIVLGNGYLSTVANNVLNVNLGTALAAGECRVVAIGTEE